VVTRPDIDESRLPGDGVGVLWRGGESEIVSQTELMDGQVVFKA